MKLPVKRGSLKHNTLCILKVIGPKATIKDFQETVPKRYSTDKKTKSILDSLVASNLAVCEYNCYTISEFGNSTLYMVANNEQYVYAGKKND